MRLELMESFGMQEDAEEEVLVLLWQVLHVEPPAASDAAPPYFTPGIVLLGPEGAIPEPKTEQVVDLLYKCSLDVGWCVPELVSKTISSSSDAHVCRGAWRHGG